MPCTKPLTREQQALCTQWHALACKYTLKAMARRPDLHHHMEEALSLAGMAVVRAALVYKPARGSFAACLKWWVLATVRLYAVHGSPVVHRSERQRRVVIDWSLNANLDDADATHLDMVPAEVVDVDGALDAASLMARTMVELPEVLARRGGRNTSQRAAIRTVDVWVRRTLNGQTSGEVADELGVSRQRVDQLRNKGQDAFDTWARALREEA